uniref:Uncharacterized protein n=1 Tax=Otarine gammaherpesvirus 4 TaxID=2801541 RepID=A0A889IVX4_9GAMA|nr:hypothetical protein [Otarine gammaherpesvirus 4]
MASASELEALKVCCANSSLLNHNSEDNESCSEDSCSSDHGEYYCYSDYGSETNLHYRSHSSECRFDDADGIEQGTTDNNQKTTIENCGTYNSDASTSTYNNGYLEKQAANTVNVGSKLQQVNVPISGGESLPANNTSAEHRLYANCHEYMELTSPMKSKGTQTPLQYAPNPQSVEELASSVSKTTMKQPALIQVPSDQPPPIPPKLHNNPCHNSFQRFYPVVRSTDGRCSEPTYANAHIVPDMSFGTNTAKTCTIDLVSAKCIFKELADTTQVVYNVLTAVMLPNESTQHLSASEHTLAWVVTQCIKEEWPRLTGMVFDLPPPENADHYNHVMRVVEVAHADDSGSWGRLCITLAFICVYAKCYMNNSREIRDRFANLLSDYYALNRMSWLINMGGITKGVRGRFPLFWMWYKLKEVFSSF